MEESDIDFVVTWVDGNDPEWLKEKNIYLEQDEDVDEMGGMDSRFREWNLLRFWFRGIDKFAPWVHKIHFVTWGHVPNWLNLDHPKLDVVTHKDFIPEGYLPTFNSHTIEFNLHRIEGLTERFVYFNDDMYLCRQVSPEDFFSGWGKLPCDNGIMECLIPQTAHTSIYQLNALAVLNDHFSANKGKKDLRLWFNKKYGVEGLVKNSIFRQYSKFIGFQNDHLPTSYLKYTFEELWEQEGKRLDQTCQTRFRSPGNISIWLVRYWQLAKGQFFPTSPKTKGKNFTAYNSKMLSDIASGKYKMICVNDLCDTQEEFELWQPQVHAAFEKLLPEKSDYEF